MLVRDSERRHDCGSQTGGDKAERGREFEAFVHSIHRYAVAGLEVIQHGRTDVSGGPSIQGRSSNDSTVDSAGQSTGTATRYGSSSSRIARTPLLLAGRSASFDSVTSVPSRSRPTVMRSISCRSGARDLLSGGTRSPRIWKWPPTGRFLHRPRPTSRAFPTGSPFRATTAPRSQSIGRQLLTAAQDWARERGATHLELDSGNDRTPRTPLLRKPAADVALPMFQLDPLITRRTN
jgi:Acetyltransferase (GNAT) family